MGGEEGAFLGTGLQVTFGAFLLGEKRKRRKKKKRMEEVGRQVLTNAQPAVQLGFWGGTEVSIPKGSGRF